MSTSALCALHEPPYTDPYVRWCGSWGLTAPATRFATGKLPFITAAAGIAFQDVYLENARQQASPLHPVTVLPSLAGLATATVLTDFGQGTGTRHDLCTISCRRRQHPVISDQVESRRGHQSRQLFYQLHR